MSEITAPSNCAACGEALQGKYCHRCGEKILARGDYAFKMFFTDLIYATTHLDHKFLASLRLLFSRPGALTQAYIAGKRKNYVKPITLFVVANVIYFFMQPLANINTFNSTLHAQRHWFPYSGMVANLVVAKINHDGLELAEYEKTYNLKSEHLAKTLIILQIPLFALGVWLMQARSKRFYFEHLVFATHFYAFFLFLNIIATLAVFVYFKAGGNAYNLEIPLLVVLSIYLAFALKKVYAANWLATILQSALLVAGSVLVIFIYRFLLFLVTFYTA